MGKPRNWHVVNAISRTSAGPMKDKRKEIEDYDEQLWTFERGWYRSQRADRDSEQYDTSESSSTGTTDTDDRDNQPRRSIPARTTNNISDDEQSLGTNKPSRARSLSTGSSEAADDTTRTSNRASKADLSTKDKSTGNKS